MVDQHAMSLLYMSSCVCRALEEIVLCAAGIPLSTSRDVKSHFYLSPSLDSQNRIVTHDRCRVWIQSDQLWRQIDQAADLGHCRAGTFQVCVLWLLTGRWQPPQIAPVHRKQTYEAHVSHRFCSADSIDLSLGRTTEVPPVHSLSTTSRAGKHTTPSTTG